MVMGLTIPGNLNINMSVNSFCHIGIHYLLQAYKLYVRTHSRANGAETLSVEPVYSFNFNSFTISIKKPHWKDF